MVSDYSTSGVDLKPLRDEIVKIQTNIYSVDENNVADAEEMAETAILLLKESVDGLLDSPNFNISLANILNLLSPAVNIISQEIQQLESLLYPHGYERPEFESVEGEVDQSVHSTLPVEEYMSGSQLVDGLEQLELCTPIKEQECLNNVETPTFESLGLSKTAMEVLGERTPREHSSLSSMISPQLNTISKSRAMVRDSFSSVESPQLATLKMKSRTSETICKSIELVDEYEYKVLDEFVSNQFDLEELNEGVELINDLLTDKQLKSFGSPDSSNLSTAEIENLGIGPRHKALLLALLQLKRLCMIGYDENGRKIYQIE